MPVIGGWDADVFTAVGAMASVAVGCDTVAVGATMGGVSVGADSVGSAVGGSVGGRDVGLTVGPIEQPDNVRITILIRMVLFFIFSPIYFLYEIRAYFEAASVTVPLCIVLVMY